MIISYVGTRNHFNVIFIFIPKRGVVDRVRRILRLTFPTTPIIEIVIVCLHHISIRAIETGEACMKMKPINKKSFLFAIFYSSTFREYWKEKFRPKIFSASSKKERSLIFVKKTFFTFLSASEIRRFSFSFVARPSPATRDLLYANFTGVATYILNTYTHPSIH